jgi:protein-S-isoprenylcysteine O-methyltransferase Ste14
MRSLAVRTGNVLFRWRNALGPLLFVSALLLARPSHPFGRADLDLAFDAAGVVIALLGQGLRVLTIGFRYIERGGRNRQVWASKLVEGGVFAHCRNPMYVGNILIALGLALIVHSTAFYLVLLPAVVLAYTCIVFAEEAYLRRQFGAGYDEYCARVNRWWPRWRGFGASTRNMRFNWRRVLVKEYNTAFLLVLALAGAWLWSEYATTGRQGLPSAELLTALLVGWLALYLLVRLLKKSRLIHV